jgi:hypothetical protein
MRHVLFNVESNVFGAQAASAAVMAAWSWEKAEAAKRSRTIAGFMAFLPNARAEVTGTQVRAGRTTS